MRFWYKAVFFISIVGVIYSIFLTLSLAVKNILQNAVEAAVKADVPRIRVEFVEHRKEIFIVVSNSVAERINTKSDLRLTSKKDKENHGFGLKNIIATVEKYHGECYMESLVENREALFKISIAIPTAEAEEKKK